MSTGNNTQSFFAQHYSTRTIKTMRNREISRKIAANKYIKKLSRKFQSENNGSLALLKEIPKGYYCYDFTDYNDKVDPPVFLTKKCPFWYSIEIPKEEQGDHVGLVAMGQSHIGGCKLIGKTDDDMDGWGLLWDQCKECPF